MNHSILLVDDQEDIISVLERILADYPVTSVFDGKTALARIKADRPALVILDVSMPGMSGVEVLEKIMLMDYKPLVLMLTADEAIETAAKTMGLGAFAYITKPFETAQILEQVAKALAFSDQKAGKGAPEK